MVKSKTKYKIKWKNLTIIFIILILIAILIFAGRKFSECNRTKTSIEKVREEVEIGAAVDDELTTTIKPDSSLSKFDAYWDYIKQGLLDIDMSKLKRINTDAVGYIEIKGTSFSYPVVQKDNSFYKNHSFDKSENSFGWIYMDETNELDEFDTNTIIYGNKNLFGPLANDLNELFKDDWKMEDDNYIIKMFTNESSTLWQIISVYKTKEKDHLKTSFEDEKEIEEYIKSLLEKTEIKLKGYAKPDDKFLTITTNSGGTNIVVQAKLIKIRK